MNYRLKKILLKPMDFLYWISPALELKIMFWLQLGEKLDLKKPQTYNEKLQWIKLNFKDSRMPICVDKYTVRKFVENRGLGHILNELYWDGVNPNEIPRDILPGKFVIKATHGSGFNIIVENQENINWESTISTLNKWLNTNFIPSYGEWFYGVVEPRIIIEKNLSNKKGEVPEDYKIMCFDGKPKYIIVDTDRFKVHKRNIYDLDWRFLRGYEMGFPNDEPIPRPSKLKEMLEISSILSKGFPHARIDLFLVGSKIFFGEITFTNGSGFDRILPPEFDLELGSYINIESLISF